MNLIERVKNILVTPKTEWDVINGETATPMSLLTSYVIPLALIPAIASFIGWGLIGVSYFGVKIGGMGFGIAMAVQSFVGAIISFYVSSYIIDALAPTFKSEKDINKSAQLVAYASTAAWVAGIFNILPALAILGILGLYSIYLFYVGLPKLKKTPQDQVVPYMLVSALVLIVISLVIGFILTRVIYGVVGNPYATATVNNLNDLFK
jgi:Yip1 domain